MMAFLLGGAIRSKFAKHPTLSDDISLLRLLFSARVRPALSCHTLTSHMAVPGNALRVSLHSPRRVWKRRAAVCLARWVLVPTGSGSMLHLSKPARMPQPIVLSDDTTLVVGRALSSTVNTALAVPTGTRFCVRAASVWHGAQYLRSSVECHATRLRCRGWRAVERAFAWDGNASLALTPFMQ